MPDETWVVSAFDSGAADALAPTRKRLYGGRTRNVVGPRRPPNLSTYPGLPAAAFAESAVSTIYGNGPGRPYFHDITRIQEQVATIRESLGLALERWQRILVAAREEGNAHIAARAANEIEGLYDILARLDKL